MRHDKMITRRRLIEAVQSILSRKQSSEIGINAVAKEAGIDKVMIYRYFGSMDKLLIAFAEDQETWPPLSRLLKKRSKSLDEGFLGDIITEYLANFLAELRRDRVAQEILRWDFIQKNALTNFVNDEREKQGKSLMGQIPFDQNKFPENDLAAIIALLHAGIIHLVLCAKNSEVYMGIDLKSARGWKRVEKALDELIKSYCLHELVPANK